MTLAPAARPYDLITLGDMCVDLIVTGEDVTPRFGQVEKLVDDYHLELGGSCCLLACQAARLGLRVAILGRVGDDDYGRLILRRLMECGVDTQAVTVDARLKTGLGLALAQGDDRAILTYLGSICAIRPQDITDEFLASARHLHHGSYFLHTGLQPHLPDILRRARALGLSTSLDTNWDPAERWNGTLRASLALTDLFLPNEQEAARISGQRSADAAAAELLAWGPRLVAIKQGAAGATLYGHGAPLHRDVEPARGGDSTGAGDSFDAGFLAGWLRGLPLERCLALACACGRSVASEVGGLRGQPTWEQIAARLDLPNQEEHS